jgi:hypothetical protein
VLLNFPVKALSEFTQILVAKTLKDSGYIKLNCDGQKCMEEH